MTRLFREYQIARFNELYYQSRSASLRMWSKLSSIVSSLAASLVLANLLTGPGNSLFGFGPVIWQLLTLFAAVLAAANPVLGLSEKASQMETASLGHGVVKDRLQRLLADLKVSDIQPSHTARDEEIHSLRLALSALDERPVEKLREECWSKTLEEIPSENAWSMV